MCCGATLTPRTGVCAQRFQRRRPPVDAVARDAAVAKKAHHHLKLLQKVSTKPGLLCACPLRCGCWLEEFGQYVSPLPPLCAMLFPC